MNWTSVLTYENVAALHRDRVTQLRKLWGHRHTSPAAAGSADERRVISGPWLFTVRPERVTDDVAQMRPAGRDREPVSRDRAA
jgi:hypothetical protein